MVRTPFWLNLRLTYIQKNSNANANAIPPVPLFFLLIPPSLFCFPAQVFNPFP